MTHETNKPLDDAARVDAAMQFLAVPWLASKECSALASANAAVRSEEAFVYTDEARRCRATIIQLNTLRDQLAAAHARAERLAAECRAGRFYSKFVPAMIDDDAMHEKMSDYRTGYRAAKSAVDAARDLDRKDGVGE